MVNKHNYGWGTYMNSENVLMFLFQVHDLHAHGQEIALHSITHDTMTSYWQNLDVEALVQEFGGERQLISHFANIPVDDIKGMRVPLLQLSGMFKSKRKENLI